MNMYRRFFAIGALALGLTSNAHAQNMEQRFQDLFITAGYSTAFGAAMGAAVIGLGVGSGSKQSFDPIAQGASLGFILGSALGSYVVFSPMFDVTLAATPHNHINTSFGVTPNSVGGPMLAAQLSWSHD